MGMEEPDTGTPDTGEIANPDTGLVDQPDTGVEETPDAGTPGYADGFNSGPLAVTADGMTLGYAALTGRAGLIHEKTGYTNVLVFVSGLMPNAEYGAHVHAMACEEDGGGPHYKIDPAVMEVMEANEIWPTVHTDAQGNGVGYVRVHHYAREDAKSVVVHQTGAVERIACANLSPNADVTARGTLYELPAGRGLRITGTATLRRYSGGTIATVQMNGTFTSTVTFPAHVHAQRCDDEEGGPHYKIDPSIMDADPMNEIWPNATPNATTANGSATTPHIARYDAWSIVVHDPVSKARILCADLKW